MAKDMIFLLILIPCGKIILPFREGDLRISWIGTSGAQSISKSKEIQMPVNILSEKNNLTQGLNLGFGPIVGE